MAGQLCKNLLPISGNDEKWKDDYARIYCLYRGAMKSGRTIMQEFTAYIGEAMKSGRAIKQEFTAYIGE